MTEAYAQQTDLAVIYHRNCPDGFGSAYVAWLTLRRWAGNTVYVPAQYGETPPELPPSCKVWILDFSYPRPVMESLHRRHGAANVRLLDHHRTADNELAGLPNTRINLRHSGAMLTWQEFNDGPPPLLVRYLEDRDLWKFDLPHSRDVAGLVSSYPYEFTAWQELQRRLEQDFDTSVTVGSAILDFQQRQLERLLQTAHLIDVAGHEVPAVNSPLLVSEVGDALLDAYPDHRFAAIYHQEPDHRKWSLRSRGDFDVSEVAQQMGGGGHASAASFTTMEDS